MTKILYLIAFLFLHTLISAQDCPSGDITFNSQEEVDLFLQMYPDCKEIPGSITISPAISNLNGLLGITHVGGGIVLSDHSQISNFIGLDSLVSIGTKSSVHFDNFDSGETYLASSLFISRADSLLNFKGLEQLQQLQGSIFIRFNDKLESAEGLDKVVTIGGMLYIYGNTSLDNISALSNLTQLGAGTYDEYFVGFATYETSNRSIFIRSNGSLQSISGINQLTNLDGSAIIVNNNSLTSSILPNLQSIGQDDYHHFDGISFSEHTYTTLEIRNNQNLSLCTNAALCNILSNEEFVYVQNNDIGCSFLEIIDNCNNFGSVFHPVFYDSNQNGLHEMDEPFLNNRKVNILPTGFHSYTNEEEGGNVYLNQGSYTLTLDDSALQNWDLTSDSISYYINVDSIGFKDSIYFGIYPNTNLSDMQAFMLSQAQRCNEIVTFDIMANNAGTTITEGLLWFEADSNMTNPIYVDIPDYFVEPNLFGWDFSNLYPGTSVQKQIRFQIPGPDDFPIGDDLINSTEVIFTDINGTDTSDFVFRQVLECAYDPNDKLVSPLYPQNYALIDEALFYTIRFQNTGNAEAYDVVIEDEIDPNLDINSFQFLSSSHSEVLSISIDAERSLSFEFRDIFLPDSTTNFEESQGYVSFSIKANSNIPEFTTVENYAEIYFDYNPPIVTNTTENTLISSFDSDLDGSLIWNDCDDTNENINPDLEEEPYDGLDNDCDPETLDDDLDQDGFVLTEDCDDENPEINPEEMEIPFDNIDNDCDPETLDNDFDQDGFVTPEDCDDENAQVNPSANEVPYDGIDNDCNPETLDDDLDQDGFVLAEDCDDENPDINPEEEEIVNNGIDEDCDGSDLISSITDLPHSTIQFYPNPVKDVLSLHQIGDSVSEFKVQLYDNAGKIILATDFLDQKKVINVQHLEQGLYMLNFTDKNSGKQYTSKILIQ